MEVCDCDDVIYCPRLNSQKNMASFWLQRSVGCNWWLQLSIGCSWRLQLSVHCNWWFELCAGCNWQFQLSASCNWWLQLVVTTECGLWHVVVGVVPFFLQWGRDWCAA